MKIFEDANEYINLQEWARKTIRELGYADTKKLKICIDSTIEKQKALQSGKRKAFDIDKLEGMSFSLFHELNHWQVEQFIEKVNRKKQAIVRGKRKNYHGQTSEQLSERNEKIDNHFKKSHLSESSFAKKHAAEYDLQPRMIRLILQKAREKALGN